MEVTRFGINWIYNEGSAGMIASENEIILNSDPNLNNGIINKFPAAIHFSEKNNSIPANYVAFDNIITVNGPGEGIRANAVYAPLIRSNAIRINGSSVGKVNGILVSGCNSAGINCNFINGNYPDSVVNTRGIVSKDCINNVVACNNMDSTYLGVFFGGWNPGTKFRGNDMNTHFEGLHLNSSAVIDTQFHAGNRWFGPFTSGYGSVKTDTSQFSVGASKFIIDPFMGPEYLFLYPQHNYGWISATAGTTTSCTTNTICTNIGDLISGGILDYLIAVDSVHTIDYNDETEVKAALYLYDRLQTDSILLLSDPVFITWLLARGETALDDIYEASEEILAGSEYDSTFTALYNQAESLLTVLNDSLERNGIDQPYASSLINQINYLMEVKVNLLIERDAFVYGYFDAASLIHETMLPENLVESNETFMIGIDIRLFYEPVEDLIDQYEEILAIAQQCPYAGGKSVYEARTLLSLLNDTIEFDDESICLTAGIYKSSDYSDIKANNEVEIIPNPATESIKIILNNPKANICNVDIYNAVSENIFNKLLDCKQNEYQFDIRSIVPGPYIIRISIDNSTPQIKKLIILR